MVLCRKGRNCIATGRQFPLWPSLEYSVSLSLWLNVFLWLTRTLCEGWKMLSMMERRFDIILLLARKCKGSSSHPQDWASPLNHFVGTVNVCQPQDNAPADHSIENSAGYHRLIQHCCPQGVTDVDVPEPLQKMQLWPFLLRALESLVQSSLLLK